MTTTRILFSDRYGTLHSTLDCEEFHPHHDPAHPNNHMPTPFHTLDAPHCADCID